MAKPDNNMNKVSDYEIETMLFKQIEKPKKYHMTKVFNVFNDYYRINVYTQAEEEGYTKLRINTSYMATYRDKILTIIHGKIKNNDEKPSRWS